ncbi:hypothetical protein, partial [Burkholderia pyrrocinia]|uniref:hypothetical protein n=1 Tax=Burkholderia pyrrocinia TaxID=60550 RepID=UPI001ABA0901
INMPASCKSNNTVSPSQPYCTRLAGLFRSDSLPSGNSEPKNHEISEQSIRNAVRLCDWYMMEHAKYLVRAGKSSVPANVSYEQKIDDYGRRLYEWVHQNYSRLSNEQGGRCVKVDYRMFQNAKRSISRPEDLQAAMDLVGRQFGFRVNFVGSGRGKFVCHEPNGNFCNHCVQPNSRFQSTSSGRQFQKPSSLHDGGGVPVPNPAHPVGGASFEQQQVAAEDSRHEPSLGEVIRTGGGNWLAD